MSHGVAYIPAPPSTLAQHFLAEINRLSVNALVRLKNRLADNIDKITDLYLDGLFNKKLQTALDSSQIDFPLGELDFFYIKEGKKRIKVLSVLHRVLNDKNYESSPSVVTHYGLGQGLGVIDTYPKVLENLFSSWRFMIYSAKSADDAERPCVFDFRFTDQKLIWRTFCPGNPLWPALACAILLDENRFYNVDIEAHRFVFFKALKTLGATIVTRNIQNSKAEIIIEIPLYQ